MDPITTGAIALVTLLLDKTGEILLEKSLEQGGKKLIQRLKRQSPAIEVAARNPELVEQQPEAYGEAFLVGKVEEVAKSDSEIANFLKALAQKVETQEMFNSKIYAKFKELINKVNSHRSTSQTIDNSRNETYNNTGKINANIFTQGGQPNINASNMNFGSKS